MSDYVVNELLSTPDNVEITRMKIHLDGLDS